MAFVAQHLFPGIPDVRRMWGPHNLEPGRVLPVPADPFDQEVAEAAVPG